MKRAYRPLTVATCISALTFGAPAAAQDTESAEPVEEIVITGSRIRQNPLEVRTPVQFFSEEDMNRTSAVSISDFLQELPIAGSAINRLNNSSGNLGFPPDGTGIGAGAAEIDLRNLGSKRTLVLVDGRRWVRGSSASGVSGAVDLNSIPAGSVKSIEILQDGASAVYGTDAIGGVVNIITHDSYDGFQIAGYYGGFGEGDGESAEVDMRWGAEAERTRIFVNLNHADQQEVFAGQRDISEYAIQGFPWGLSSGTPEGRIVFTDPRIGQTLSITTYAQDPVYDPACWATGTETPGCDDFQSFTLADRFNWQPYNYLLTPNQRTSVFTKTEYDLSDAVMLRLLASFNRRESTSQAAPEPLFFGPEAGSGEILDNLYWPAGHPTNPFGIDMDVGSMVFTGRRPIEAGPRIFNQAVDTMVVSLGLDGEFPVGDNTVYWDATYTYAENDAGQEKQGAFNAQNIAIALGPSDTCDAVPGCVPFAWVGPNTMTSEMLDFVTFIQKDVSNQKMNNISLNFSGDFAGLSAGPIGWALGFEHRKEDGYFIPDSIVSKGFTAGVPASPTEGGFQVDELYGEVIVPVYRGNNGQRLDLSGAVRFSDYNLFSSETVTKFGVNFAPMEDLVFRASFSEGFRAPNIGELFNTGSRFDAGITDPCSNAAPEDVANCTALGAPPPFTQLNPQISVTTGGNPNLSPETADTWTAGLTWDVGAAENWDGIESLLFEFNYYDITVDDAIQPPNAQDVLDLCVDTLDPFFCDGITRGPGGNILRIDGVLLNIASIETSGFDWKTVLLTSEGNLGQFRIEWANTHLTDYKETIPGPTGNITVDRAGTELGSPERAFVEWKSSLSADWFYNDWAARVALQYYSSLDEDCGGLVADFGLEDDFCSSGPDGNKLDAVLFTNLQATWTPDTRGSGNWSVQVGVDNVFDETIPFCASCDLNSFDGTIYPIPGQFWYTRFNYSLD
jgi:iron complex outermembrane receptor protein